MTTVETVVGTMRDDLLACQAEISAMHIAKTATNPHFNSRYIPLEQLIDDVVPVLNRYGFVLVQQPTVYESQPALRTRLMHNTGEEISDTMFLLAAQPNPQGQGAAITYARRFALMSMLGIAADPDDDGERAMQGVRDVDADTKPVNGNGHANARGSAVACPNCHGPMWDNRAENDRRAASGDKLQPDWKCRDKDGCGHVIWRPK